MAPPRQYEIARFGQRAAEMIENAEAARGTPIPVDATVLSCCNGAYDAALFHGAREVRPEHLPMELAAEAPAAPERSVYLPLGTPLRKVEEIMIRKTLEDVGGHREKAARILGISPRALQYKIARYGVARRRRDGSSGPSGFQAV